MRVIVAADDISAKTYLIDVLKRKRVCTQLDETDFENVVDAVIRLQPDLIVIGLQDERLPVYHSLVREIREIAIGRIVVVGPTAEAKAVLKFLQEGAFQYLDMGDFEVDFEAVLERLRNEPAVATAQGQAIAVVAAGVTAPARARDTASPRRRGRLTAGRAGRRLGSRSGSRPGPGCGRRGSPRRSTGSPGS